MFYLAIALVLVALLFPFSWWAGKRWAMNHLMRLDSDLYLKKIAAQEASAERSLGDIKRTLGSGTAGFYTPTFLDGGKGH